MMCLQTGPNLSVLRKAQERWLDEKKPTHPISRNLKQEHGPLGNTGDA